MQPGDGHRVLPQQEGGGIRGVQALSEDFGPDQLRGEDDSFEDEFDILVGWGVGDPEAESGFNSVENSLWGGGGVEVEANVLQVFPVRVDAADEEIDIPEWDFGFHTLGKLVWGGAEFGHEVEDALGRRNCDVEGLSADNDPVVPGAAVFSLQVQAESSSVGAGFWDTEDEVGLVVRDAVEVAAGVGVVIVEGEVGGEDHFDEAGPVGGLAVRG